MLAVLVARCGCTALLNGGFHFTCKAFSLASSSSSECAGTATDTAPPRAAPVPEGAGKMPFELIAHGVFSFVSGVSVAITGFGCDSARELFAELSTGPNAYPASSAINMGLSAALVTAVQVSGAQANLLERECAQFMFVGSRLQCQGSFRCRLQHFCLVRSYAARFGFCSSFLLRIRDLHALHVVLRAGSVGYFLLHSYAKVARGCTNCCTYTVARVSAHCINFSGTCTMGKRGSYSFLF